MNMNFERKVEMEGLYMLQTTSTITGEVKTYGPFKNVITDIGLNRIGTAGTGTNCYVGTGSGTPDTTDTGMFSQLAQTDNVQQGIQTTEGAPFYWSQFARRFRFNAGLATGNLTEVGVGWSPNPNNAIFSHALILDGSGNPTTITILPEEVLDVTYIFRVYPPLTDVSGVVNISGVPYSYTLRACDQPQSGAASAVFLGGMVGGAGLAAYSGPIGAITGAPSGTVLTGGSVVAAAYASGSYTRRFTCSWSLVQGNVVGGIRSVLVMLGGSGPPGAFRTQTEFNPVILKDNTKSMTLVYELIWARRSI